MSSTRIEGLRPLPGKNTTVRMRMEAAKSAGGGIAGTARALLLCAAVIAVSACEAPLRLEGVEQRLAEPIRRPDHFQMAAGNGQSIVVVGNQGLIVRSTDQARSWERIELAGWPALIDVAACPDGSYAALAAEGQVWISTDNGRQWQAGPIDSEEAPQAITCDPVNRIWVVGSFSTIFSSEDTGTSWQVTSLDEDIILNNIQFTDAQNGFIAGEFGTLLVTGDAGQNWQRLPDLEGDFYPQTLFFSTPQAGWIAGLEGRILHTRDGGYHWSDEQTETLAPVYGIQKAGDTLYAVGGEGTVLERSGRRWRRVEHGKPVLLYLRAILPAGRDKLLVGGVAGALHVLSLDPS